MLTVTKTRMVEGIWQGLVEGTDAAPDIVVTHLHRAVPDVTIAPETEGRWVLTIPVPVEAIGDGIQTIVISDSQGNRLNHFSVAGGEALTDDIRAELALLRDELELLKKAFRRHCQETVD